MFPSCFFSLGPLILVLEAALGDYRVPLDGPGLLKCTWKLLKSKGAFPVRASCCTWHAGSWATGQPIDKLFVNRCFNRLNGKLIDAFCNPSHKWYKLARALRVKELGVGGKYRGRMKLLFFLRFLFTFLQISCSLASRMKANERNHLTFYLGDKEWNGFCSFLSVTYCWARRWTDTLYV